MFVVHNMHRIALHLAQTQLMNIGKYYILGQIDDKNYKVHEKTGLKYLDKIEKEAEKI